MTTNILSRSRIRLPRFEYGEITRNHVLTARDHYLVACVHEHRFIRSTHLAALAESSIQVTNNRLKILHHKWHFLQRPKVQKRYYVAGSQPLAYSITQAGLKYLGIEGRVKDAEKHPSHHLFEHTMQTTDFMVMMELSARKRGVEFERLPIEPWRASAVHLGRRHEQGIKPDAVFRLNNKYFALEADTGEMALQRTDWFKQNCIEKKQVLYKALKRPFSNLRVIFFTSENGRKERMKALLPSPMFLYISKGDIETVLNADLFNYNWDSPLVDF